MLLPGLPDHNDFLATSGIAKTRPDLAECHQVCRERLRRKGTIHMGCLDQVILTSSAKAIPVRAQDTAYKVTVRPAEPDA